MKRITYLSFYFEPDLCAGSFRNTPLLKELSFQAKSQNIIIDLQSKKGISIILCDHQARDLLKCVDRAIILSNTKIIANGTPTEILNNDLAKKVYFGETFSRN